MIVDFMTYIGCLFILAVILVLVAYAHNIVQERREGYRDRQYQKAVFRARVELGRHLIQDSYWLKGEQFKTMHLLGIKLTQEGSYDISKFREELEHYEVQA